MAKHKVKRKQTYRGLVKKYGVKEAARRWNATKHSTSHSRKKAKRHRRKR